MHHIRVLPGMQGVQIVALTGWGQAVDRTRTQEAGMVAHLVKPIATEALERTLAEVSRK